MFTIRWLLILHVSDMFLSKHHNVSLMTCCQPFSRRSCTCQTCSSWWVSTPPRCESDNMLPIHWWMMIWSWLWWYKTSVLYGSVEACCMLIELSYCHNAMSTCWLVVVHYVCDSLASTTFYIQAQAQRRICWGFSSVFYYIFKYKARWIHICTPAAPCLTTRVVDVSVAQLVCMHVLAV